MSAMEDRAAAVLDELAAKASRTDLDKLDDRFAERVERLAREDKLSAETVTRLRVLWRMLKAPEADVPWSAKTIIMAALAYFAAPFDLLPDFAGKKGYADDALVIRIAYDRLGELPAKFGE